MAYFDERLRYLLDKKGISDYELAKKIGVRATTIYNLTTGYNEPSAELLSKISKYLEVDEDYLVGATDPPVIRESFTRVREVPIVNVMFGESKVIPPDNIIGKMILDQSLPTGYDYFIFLVSDDSLKDANIPKGCKATIRMQGLANNGDIALVSIDGNNAVLRKYYRNGFIIELSACNREMEFKSYTLDMRKDKFEIIGRCVRTTIDYD